MKQYSEKKIEKTERHECLRFAKDMMKEHLGMSIPMTKMILLESGTKRKLGLEDDDWDEIMNRPCIDVDYVMFRDMRTGKEYQVYSDYISEYHDHNTTTLWSVNNTVGNDAIIPSVSLAF